MVDGRLRAGAGTGVLQGVKSRASPLGRPGNHARREVPLAHRFDVIGDLRGRADALRELLANLGYAERDGAWRHPSRHAVFLGAYLGGPDPVGALAVVWRMAATGAATALMGRPELATLAFATPDPAAPGRHVRPRRGESWRREAALLAPFGGPDSEGHGGLTAMFAAMPLWFATAGFRAVHACWHPAAARALAPHLDASARVLPGALAEVLTGAARGAVETLLAGPTVSLPEGMSTLGRGGTSTRVARARWWGGVPATWAEAVAHPDRLAGEAAAPPHANAVAVAVAPSPIPTLFGSLGLDGGPCVLGPLHACLDVAGGDRLRAYRWDGERALAEVKVSSAAQPAPPVPAPPVPVPVASVPDAPPPRAGRRRRGGRRGGGR